VHIRRSSDQKVNFLLKVETQFNYNVVLEYMILNWKFLQSQLQYFFYSMQEYENLWLLLFLNNIIALIKADIKS
jgi:hypothetical protein